MLRCIAGHFKPVDATDIFAPADDLADEALRGVQRRLAGAIGLLDLATDSNGSSRPQFEILRDDGVIEERLARQHRVLVVAEARQGLVDEGGEGASGIGPGDGEPERLEISEVIAESRLDQVQDFLRDGVGRRSRLGAA